MLQRTVHAKSTRKGASCVAHCEGHPWAVAGVCGFTGEAREEALTGSTRNATEALLLRSLKKQVSPCLFAPPGAHPRIARRPKRPAHPSKAFCFKAAEESEPGRKGECLGQGSRSTGIVISYAALANGCRRNRCDGQRCCTRPWSLGCSNIGYKRQWKAPNKGGLKPYLNPLRRCRLPRDNSSQTANPFQLLPRTHPPQDKQMHPLGARQRPAQARASSVRRSCRLRQSKSPASQQEDCGSWLPWWSGSCRNGQTRHNSWL